jgi:hypothetical protein
MDDRIEGGVSLFLFLEDPMGLSFGDLRREAELLVDNPLDDIVTYEGESPGEYQVENPKISPKHHHTLPQKSWNFLYL